MTTAVATKTQICPSGSNLKDIKQQVREEFKQFGALEHEARWRAMRIGLLLVHANQLAEHGKFVEWLKDTVTDYSERHAYRFMKLARAFLANKKIDESNALLLCGENPQEDTKAKQAVQLLFEFFGDKSLNDLFDQYGIKERKPLGGARGNTHKKLTTAQALERAKKVAYEEWNRAFELLSVDTKHKTYKYLDDDEIIKLIDCLQVTRDALRAELNQRKQDRKS